MNPTATGPPRHPNRRSALAGATLTIRGITLNNSRISRC